MSVESPIPKTAMIAPGMNTFDQERPVAWTIKYMLIAPGDQSAANTKPRVRALEKKRCQSAKRPLSVDLKRLTITGMAPMLRKDVRMWVVTVVIMKRDDRDLNLVPVHALIAPS